MQKYPKNVLSDIRVHLEKEKINLTRRIQTLLEQDPFSDPDRVSDNAASDAEATEESSHDRFSALIAELHSNISDIDASLLRISDSTYGFCTNCRAMIDTDRLAILPTATLCLTCEKKRKHKNG
ncbi:TraR/DksA family transcriptional regulator [Candidatus Gottesmanbacteria bacterium]|nr:TraR/DksA family transcriptional regulator [Candidatus Gottesmanbacteria bacterium]